MTSGIRSLIRDMDLDYGNYQTPAKLAARKADTCRIGSIQPSFGPQTAAEKGMPVAIHTI